MEKAANNGFSVMTVVMIEAQRTRNGTKDAYEGVWA